MSKIWFHGTDADNVTVIVAHGFRPGTVFTASLEDALEFGGPHVFQVILETPSTEWQFTNKNYVGTSAILRHSEYGVVVHADYPNRYPISERFVEAA